MSSSHSGSYLCSAARIMQSESESEPTWTLWSGVKFKSGPSDSDCLLHRMEKSSSPCSLHWHQILVSVHWYHLPNQNMHRRGIVDLRGPHSYVITGPNPQFYRKVPIINPVHRSLASQHSWRPERSMKLAVGASGGVLPPHSHHKQSQYSRFLHLVVAYGDGYSIPPIPGVQRGSLVGP